MKKKKSLIWKLALFIAIIAIVVIVLISHQKTQLKNVEIKVVYLDGDTLVTPLDLQNVLDKKYGTLQGVEVQNINTAEIENTLRKNPYLAKVDAFISIRGNLQIKAEQRKPIVRILTRKNKTFYLDQNGVGFPISSMGTSHVLVANGNIKDLSGNQPISIELLRKDSVLNKSQFIEIFDLAKYIDNDNFLRAQIDQIYINENNEIELVPKVGNQIILLGNAENLAEKFKKLVALYQEGFANLGWDVYTAINLKFKNQVVCTKK